MRLPARRGSAAFQTTLVGLEGSAVPPALRLGGAAIAALTPMILIWALLSLILHHFPRVLLWYLDCTIHLLKPETCKPSPFHLGPGCPLVWQPLGGSCYSSRLIGHRDKSTSFQVLGDHLCVCWLELTTKRGPAVDQRFFFYAVTHLISLSHPQAHTPTSRCEREARGARQTRSRLST